MILSQINLSLFRNANKTSLVLLGVASTVFAAAPPAKQTDLMPLRGDDDFGRVIAQFTTIKDLSNLLALRGVRLGSNGDEDPRRVHPTQLLVQFKSSTSRAQKDETHLQAGVLDEIQKYSSVKGLYLVEVAENQRERALASYAAAPGVLHVQPNHGICANVVPDDPSFPLQWGLQNTGQTVEEFLGGGDDPGTPGADIRAEGAWNLTTGNAAFRIAVLDSGVDYNHPDLAANIWTNPGETGLDEHGMPKETNDVDDDGNGWIDDVHGYDFVNRDGDPMDDYFHGTHVAGIIGAVGNNGIGVTGVNWQCQIVALKILDSTGIGFESDAIDAIDYLIDNGILLSNNSWGRDGEFSPALHQAVGELQSIGHLFVAAAGDSVGRNIDDISHYPASFDFPHLIAVAGVDNDDVLSVFSNIGPISVDLAAPGDNVWSTLPGNSYGLFVGTSMATPYVTGTAALLWGRRPELIWSDVRSRLLRSVRRVPSLIGRTVTGGIIDASVAVGDCNHNGVPDEEDIAQGGSEDCNSDGVPDECEPDCNGNGAPDECDIDSGFSQDCNDNAIPDECELATGSSEDCNGNAVPDECDLVSGGSEDLNGSGVPDECETCAVATDCDDGNFCTENTCSANLCSQLEHTEPCDDGDACTIDDVCQSGVCVGTRAPASDCLPVLSMAAVAINGNPISGGPISEVTVTQGDRLTVEIFLRNWLPRRLLAYGLAIDPSGYTSGMTGSLSPVVDPTPNAGAFVEREHPDFVFFGRTALTIVNNSDPSFYQYLVLTLFDEDCAADAGGSAYLGTLILDIGETALGRFELCLDEREFFTDLLECTTLSHIKPTLFECLTIRAPPDDCTTGEDCNGNGSWDICDITNETSEDCNSNDIPDECDVADHEEMDCNGNGVPDECDIDSGFSQDCNDNAIPDECELAVGSSEDCNGNDVPDECDVADQDEIDCNGNGVPDECEPDCNGNGLPDECDVDSGLSEDCNVNGLPDECDIDPTDPDGNSFVSDDCNGNGVPDECEPDCNESGLPDECDVDSGFSEDCNRNRRPDECDLDSGISEDCNANGLPDECDIDPTDPDGNSFVSDDCNGNGVPDECDGSGLVLLGTQYAAGNGPRSVAIGDLDGDQLPDLAVANRESDRVSVLLGVGDGRFVTWRSYGTGEIPYSVALGDLDGDQLPDLAVANRNSDSVSVLLGVGEGLFAVAVHYAAGDGPQSVALGDLDGDQVPDLALANAFSDDVSVLLGLGNGTFAPVVNYAAGDGPRSVAIGNLNSDQVPDLAVTNGRNDNVSVLLGVGDGTFASAVNYAAGDGPSPLAIGDLNGDQKADLAVANRSSGNVSVLLGLGDGTFAAAAHFAAVDGPSSVVIGDLNDDQAPDLAVTNRDSANVTVLLGVGDGAFGAAVNYAVGEVPYSVAIGDLNGDQMLDLAVANRGGDNVSVLLNRSLRGCNANCIPDECDIDCGPPGSPCDLPGCGQSVDCNCNEIPDECEIDADISISCPEVSGPCKDGPFFCFFHCDADINRNGIPDCCDEGVPPDSCPGCQPPCGMVDLTDATFADDVAASPNPFDRPGNCAIDAREPHNINDRSARNGWDRMVLSFSCDPTAIGMVASDFSADSTRAGNARGIQKVIIDNIANTATVLLDDMMTPGEWTCMEHLGSGRRWCAGYLPGDTNLDGAVTTGDISALIDSINFVPNRLLPNYASDLNRSGVPASVDILRLIDLLNGAGEFDPWITRRLPPCPSEQ